MSGIAIGRTREVGSRWLRERRRPCKLCDIFADDELRESLIIAHIVFNVNVTRGQEQKVPNKSECVCGDLGNACLGQNDQTEMS
jgi:hypothetical protein